LVLTFILALTTWPVDELKLLSLISASWFSAQG
jgi:hypothetical protein